MAKQMRTQAVGITKKPVGEAYRGKHADNASKSTSTKPSILPKKVPSGKTEAKRPETGKKDYFQRLAYTKQRSKFNKNVKSMASGGMLRGRIAMRYLDKPRFMVLMEKMTKQLQAGDNGWIGSLHSIIKLVRMAVSKNIGKEQKQKQAKPVDTKKYMKKPKPVAPVKTKPISTIQKSFIKFDVDPTPDMADILMKDVWEYIDYVEDNSDHVAPYFTVQKAASPKDEHFQTYLNTIYNDPASLHNLKGTNAQVHKHLPTMSESEVTKHTTAYFKNLGFSKSYVHPNSVYQTVRLATQHLGDGGKDVGLAAPMALMAIRYHRAEGSEQTHLKTLMNHTIKQKDDKYNTHETVVDRILRNTKGAIKVV